MKVKELIQRLQEADPTGEEYVSCGYGITGVQVEPAYYDGCQVVYELDVDDRITRALVRGQGAKIVIDSTPLSLAVNDPDLPVEFDSEYARHHYEPKVRGWRTEQGECVRNVHLEAFTTHVWGRLRVDGWFDANREYLRSQEGYNTLRADITAWFDANREWLEEQRPAHFLRGRSPRECQNDQWFHTVRVEMENGRVVLSQFEEAGVLS